MSIPTDPKALLTATAIRYLSYRPRFCIEVETHLYQKATNLGLPDPTTLINQILTSLKNSRYLDDQVLLASFVHHRLVDRTRGPYWIRSRLTHLGLAKGTIDAALRQFAPPVLQIQILQQYLANQNCSGPANKARLFRRLLGRGFSSDVINQACKFDSG